MPGASRQSPVVGGIDSPNVCTTQRGGGTDTRLRRLASTKSSAQQKARRLTAGFQKLRSQPGQAPAAISAA